MGMQRKRKLELFLEKERSTSLVRGTTNNKSKVWEGKPFQSTSLVRGTTGGAPMAKRKKIFQSTSLVRGTTTSRTNCPVDFLFQSTSLVRGTTGKELVCIGLFRISIHVPRERDDPRLLFGSLLPIISIHVPRERDDWPGSGFPLSFCHFNPRPS